MLHESVMYLVRSLRAPAYARTHTPGLASLREVFVLGCGLGCEHSVLRSQYCIHPVAWTLVCENKPLPGDIFFFRTLLLRRPRSFGRDLRADTKSSKIVYHLAVFVLVLDGDLAQDSVLNYVKLRRPFLRAQLCIAHSRTEIEAQQQLVQSE